MEESIFWEKLAKHLSSNQDEQFNSFRKYLIQDTDLNRKRAVREASLMFGKSEKEIQDKFEKLDQEINKQV